jgi:GNAT superfamily N-acetyltransferase
LHLLLSNRAAVKRNPSADSAQTAHRSDEGKEQIILDIYRYEPGMAAALTALYNTAVRPVPHSYPVRRATLAAALAGVSEDHGRAYRRDDAVWVAQTGTDVTGFVHAGIGRVRRNDPDEAGLIRFLWYQPGQRAAGVALLEQAERYLAGLGATRVVAFDAHHRYPFYQLGSSHLSDRIGHVAALLGRCGYAKSEGEVYLDWRDFAVVAPGPDAFDVRYTVEYPQGAGRLPGVTVRAWRGETQVGVCVNLCVGDHTPARAAHDWLFTDWLGVDEDYQGRGLGRSLLRRALAVGRAVGYRHASISTDWRNHRAFLFYSNFGYQVSDWTYAYARTLA